MRNYRFIESQECRSLLFARELTREEALKMHAERIVTLEAEGWRREGEPLDIRPHLQREGQEVCLVKGVKSRLLCWEEVVTCCDCGNEVLYPDITQPRDRYECGECYEEYQARVRREGEFRAYGY